MFITKPAPDADALASKYPDTHNHPSLPWSIAVTNGLFIPVVICFVGARMFTRAFMTKQLFADDYIMLSAAFFFLLQCAINLAAMGAGFGAHVWDVPGSSESDRITNRQHVLRLNFVSLVFLSICLCLAKLSIITTLLYIFTPQTIKLLRNILLATGVVVVVCCVIQTFLVIFQCHPIHLSWEISEIGREGSCMSIEAAVVGSGTVNLITDIIITVAPVRYFLRLNMPWRQKLCLCALFLSGAVACAISLFRVASTKGVENNRDFTYAPVTYYNWSVAETGLCIITGSIPPLRPLIATIVPDFFKATSLTTMAMSVKESMRRPSFSRASSRRSSIELIPPAPVARRNSDTSSTAAPPLNTKDHDLRGAVSAQCRHEPDSPKQLGARAADILRPWSPAPLLAVAKQGLSRLGEGFPRADSSVIEEIGRPLSVINELDEVIDAETRRRSSAHIDSVPPLGRNGFEYIMLKLGTVPTRLQDARWKLLGWRYDRSRRTLESRAMTPGSIIVIKEVVTQSERQTV